MFRLQFDFLGSVRFDEKTLRHAIVRHAMQDNPNWDHFSAFNEQVYGKPVVDLEPQSLSLVRDCWIESLEEAKKKPFLVRYAQLRADSSHQFEGCEILSESTGLRFAAQRRDGVYHIVTVYFATGALPSWTPEGHRNAFRQAYCKADGLSWLPRKVVHGSNGSMRANIRYFLEELWFQK